MKLKSFLKQLFSLSDMMQLGDEIKIIMDTDLAKKIDQEEFNVILSIKRVDILDDLTLIEVGSVDEYIM